MKIKLSIGKHLVLIKIKYISSHGLNRRLRKYRFDSNDVIINKIRITWISIESHCYWNWWNWRNSSPSLLSIENFIFRLNNFDRIFHSFAYFRRPSQLSFLKSHRLCRKPFRSTEMLFHVLVNLWLGWWYVKMSYFSCMLAVFFLLFLYLV